MLLSYNLWKFYHPFISTLSPLIISVNPFLWNAYYVARTLLDMGNLRMSITNMVSSPTSFGIEWGAQFISGWLRDIHWWMNTHTQKKQQQKRCPFHHRGLECKTRKSRDTWSNRQLWPWSAEWSRAKAKRVLQREHTSHSKHPLPTTQEKTLHMDITRWSTPKSDWLFSLQPKMQKLYTVSKNKTGRWPWLKSWTPYCKIQT